MNHDQSEVITNEDEDSCFPGQNDNKGVPYIVENNLQSGEEDGESDDNENIVGERKELSSRVKKNHPIHNIIGNLDDGVTI